MRHLLYIVILVIPSLLLAQENNGHKQTNESIEEAYMKANKQSIELAMPMINFFLKYEGADSTKPPTQQDFDQMLKETGLIEELQNDNSGLTKEDAFQIIDAYIKADRNVASGIKEENSGTNIILEEERKAKELFEQMQPEMEKVLKDAEKEAYQIQKQMQMQMQNDVISYAEFKKTAKAKHPNMSDAKIKEAYDEYVKLISF